jgi:hypothetical protein
MQGTDAPGRIDDVARDFNTLRIDAWEWTGTSWKPISGLTASPSR